MLPPERAFDVPEWTQAKARPDHYIQVRRPLCLVPWPHVGHHVHVRIDRSTVRVYRKTELIKMHLRRQPGGRATDPRTPRHPKSLGRSAVFMLPSGYGEHVAKFSARFSRAIPEG